MRQKTTHQPTSAYALTDDQRHAWDRLTEAGRLAREAKHGLDGKKGRVDKNGGIALNKDDESHARACAYVLLYAGTRISVHKALAATGADWLVVTTLANHNQEFHDAWMAMYQAQAERIRGQSRSLVDDTMAGEEVSNAQGRMAAWALERLDDDFKSQPASATSQAQAPALTGGIVINLVASACDKPVANVTTIDAELVKPLEIGHDDD